MPNNIITDAFKSMFLGLKRHLDMTTLRHWSKKIKFLINIKNENLSYKILLTPNKPQTFLGGCLNVPSDFLDYIEFLKTNPS